MELDDIDKQILRALFIDGRENLTSLTDTVIKKDQASMSHTGVRKRIEKLKDSQILKVQGNLSINNLNYKIAFILLEMKNYDEIKKIKESYSECPRVFLLSQLSGRYNMILGIIGHSMDILERYMNYCGPTNKEGVLHSEILFSSNITTPSFLPLNLFSKNSKESKCDNTCKDCEAFLNSDCYGCGNF